MHSNSSEMLEYAAGLLEGQVPRLAEEALSRILAEVDYYADPALAAFDVTASGHAALGFAVASLGSPARFAESGEYAWQLGHKRASEGVPRLAVVKAYRIGASVLWDAMVDAVMRHDPGRASRMAYAANDFWRLVHRDILLLSEAHRRVWEGGPPGHGRKLYPVLKALLRGHKDPLDLSAAAIVLDLPMYGEYAVARLEGGAPIRPDAAPVCEDAGQLRLFWCPQGDGWAVLVRLGGQSLDDLGVALARHGEFRGGVSPVVDSLAELGRANALAELALSTGTGPGLASLREGVFAGFVLSRPSLAADLASLVLGPVLALEPSDRRLLLDTFTAWLECHGAAGEVAERLYCHRNTVLNRLHRLERLTSRRLDKPRDLVDLTLALDVVRLTTGAP